MNKNCNEISFPNLIIQLSLSVIANLSNGIQDSNMTSNDPMTK